MAAQLWHKAPFVRLLAALASGAIVQWYRPLSQVVVATCVGSALLLIILFALAPVRLRFRFRFFTGLCLLLLLACAGVLLVRHHDIRNTPAWFGHTYQQGAYVKVTIEEPLVEKANSYKAIALVSTVYRNKTAEKTTGEIILYFKKDSVPPLVHYGSQFLLSSLLQPIKNAGNPGSFDYKTYSLFKGITHQVFVTKEDYVVLPETSTNWFKIVIYNSRAWVISTLRHFIPGPKEQGLAEALLIGYKDDLDKNLVQAYSNTGVVHIIAISGLHLGLIYALLVLLTKPLKRVSRLRWIRFLVIVAGLWLFSILAGSGPSVLRSALMFSILALGETAFRKTNLFNTLAFSAFILLCINPFLLWDVGFQLSYAAVLSIVLFFQPIYNSLQLDNKLADFVWKLSSVTLAAQILTLPISVFHFHQMPLLFLLTNLVAVPVGSMVLIGLLVLCGISFLPAVAGLLGGVLAALISFLNNYIESIDRLPFVTWNALSISVVQTILLVLFAFFFCYWWMQRQRRFARIASVSFAAFMLLRGLSFFDAYSQRKLIVYNVPRHTAMDIISGRDYVFLGDSLLLHDGFERNFHLQPSRIRHRISPQQMTVQRNDFYLSGKRLLWISEALPFAKAEPKQKIDVLVLSKNAGRRISQLLHSFAPAQIVMDGSVPMWKAAAWKKECDSLQIPCYNVSEEGAYVLNW